MDESAHTGFRDRTHRRSIPVPTGCLNPGERKREPKQASSTPIRHRREPAGCGVDAAHRTRPKGPRTRALASGLRRAALALTHLNERDRARDLAAEEVALARALDQPRALGMALRAHGLINEAATEPTSSRRRSSNSRAPPRSSNTRERWSTTEPPSDATDIEPTPGSRCARDSISRTAAARPCSPSGPAKSSKPPERDRADTPSAAATPSPPPRPASLKWQPKGRAPPRSHKPSSSLPRRSKRTSATPTKNSTYTPARSSHKHSRSPPTRHTTQPRSTNRDPHRQAHQCLRRSGSAGDLSAAQAGGRGSLASRRDACRTDERRIGTTLRGRAAQGT